MPRTIYLFGQRRVFHLHLRAWRFCAVKAPLCRPFKLIAEIHCDFRHNPEATFLILARAAFLHCTTRKMKSRCQHHPLSLQSSCFFLTSSVEGTPPGGSRHDVGFFVGFSPPFDTRCRFDLRPSDARGLPARPPPGDSGDVSGDKPTSASNRVGFFTTAPFFRPESEINGVK